MNGITGRRVRTRLRPRRDHRRRDLALQGMTEQTWTTQLLRSQRFLTSASSPSRRLAAAASRHQPDRTAWRNSDYNQLARARRLASAIAFGKSPRSYARHGQRRQLAAPDSLAAACHEAFTDPRLGVACCPTRDTK
jgi:hypothetical protein